MSSGQHFVLAIIALSTFGWIVQMWLRTRQGLSPDDDGKPALGADAARQIHVLAAENNRLTGQVGRLEERIAVLERIATDPAIRTAREIDSLR